MLSREPHLLRNGRRWRDYYPRAQPGSLDYPFIELEDRLISTLDEEVKRDFKMPSTRVTDIAEAAMRQGAKLMHKWDVSKWGLAACFSLPESESAWMAADDFDLGRFTAVSVWWYGDIAFGKTVSAGGDLDQTARFVLTHGLRKDHKDLIKSIVKVEQHFPVGPKVRKLWRPGEIDALQDRDVVFGLRYLQDTLGVDPRTALAATKTVEIINEQHP